ncbi:MAG: CoA-binding protein [Planctomycetota bacterium]
MDNLIAAFLASPPFAVVGASNDREKYGNKVLRRYRQGGYQAYAVHPTETEIEGEPCYPNLASLPEQVENVSIITPPSITERIVEEAAAAGVKRVWMQPGAESQAAIDRARSLGLEVIAGGPCVLVALATRDR